MKIRNIILLFGSALSITACDGLREALTAHTDVAARAEAQELSVERLSNLLGNSALQIQVNRDVAMLVADLWNSYQLLGLAGARGDSLNDPKVIDEATLGVTSNIKLRRYMEQVAAGFKADSASESHYNQATGGLLVARHILFPVPGGATQEQKDSVRRAAERVRNNANAQNFAQLARQYGNDGTKEQGGNLGAFRRGDMVEPFYNGVAALRPGQIGLVETNFGYHVIMRPTYGGTTKEEFDRAFGETSMRSAESTYVAKLDADSRIELKSNAASLAKTAVRDMNAHRDDNDVMATYRGGQLDVGRFVVWIESYPPQMRLAQNIGSPQTPDSLVQQIIKSIARNEVMLMKADSAGIKLTDEERTQLHGEFRSVISRLQQQMGVAPEQLGDSAKSTPERERLAASRVEAFLDRIMSGQAEPISVPPPVQAMLSAKYDSRTYPAGIDRAVERAQGLRATADSTRAAQQPPSQVPLPGAPAGRDTGTKRP